MTSRETSLAAIAIMVIATCTANAFGRSEPVFLSPTPYLSADDIPIGFYAGGVPDVLEDLEDGSLDPSMYAYPGGPRGPGSHTDSVDADDGVIDGLGLDGTSWVGTVGADGIEVHFEPPYPTAAGMVWTDGYGVVTFEAFYDLFQSLGTVGPVDIADDSQDGTTAEDHFFGVQYAEGITSIKLTCISGNIEVDHLQYGSAGPATSVPDLNSAVRLGQNVPNPFNPVTTIVFELPREGTAEVGVYDVSGRLVKVLADGEYPDGEHKVLWNGRDTDGREVASGVYFYKMKSDGFEAARKMILLK